MYCPQCANENAEAVKFCRVCGTNLELVALVLAGKPIQDNSLATIPAWLETQRAGTKQIVQGSVLLIVSGLIGLVSFLTVSNPDFPWFVFWVVFFGWLAGWGAISLSFGFSKAIEARLALRQLASQTKKLGNDSITPGVETEPAHLSSVTEHTTRQLQEKRS